MIVRIVLGALASAVVMMLWGFVFWAVLVPPGGAMQAIPDEPGFAATLRERLPGSGTYYFPMPPTEAAGPEAMERFRQRSLAGPTGMVQVRMQGHRPLGPGMLAGGFAQLAGAGLLAAVLVAVCLPVLEGYFSRLLFVVLLGAFANVATRLGEPIWWQLPWGHHLYSMVFSITGWALAGVVLAAVVRAPRGYTFTDQSKPLWKRALDAR